MGAVQISCGTFAGNAVAAMLFGMVYFGGPPASKSLSAVDVSLAIMLNIGVSLGWCVAGVAAAPRGHDGLH